MSTCNSSDYLTVLLMATLSQMWIEGQHWWIGVRNDQAPLPVYDGCWILHRSLTKLCLSVGNHLQVGGGNLDLLSCILTI